MRPAQQRRERRELILTAQQRRRLDGQVVRVGVECLERGEVGGQVGPHQLIQLLRLLQILEAVRSHSAQRHPLGQGVLHQHPRRFGEQHLPTMPGGGDASGAHHIQPDVVVAHQLRGAGEQPDAHPQAGAPRPRMVRQRACRIGSGSHGVGRGGEGDEEGITLGVHLGPGVRGKRSA
jgi:hypothetical protein